MLNIQFNNRPCYPTATRDRTNGIESVSILGIYRRTGNPISLCLVYILIARRLRLPMTGIGLPGHFICRFQSSAAEIYIGTFNAGKFLTKADCVQFLLHGNYSLNDDYLAPVTARRTLMRISGNLHQIYQQLSLADEATRIQRYLIALAR